MNRFGIHRGQKTNTDQKGKAGTKKAILYTIAKLIVPAKLEQQGSTIVMMVREESIRLILPTDNLFKIMNFLYSKKLEYEVSYFL
jgi:hypothetical protein